MSHNWLADRSQRPIDPVHELDEVIRLIRFLSRCKPGGFTATLGWVEEKLRVVRAEIDVPVAAQHTDFSDPSRHDHDVRGFPLLTSIASLSAKGNGS